MRPGSLSLTTVYSILGLKRVSVMAEAGQRNVHDAHAWIACQSAASGALPWRRRSGGSDRARPGAPVQRPRLGDRDRHRAMRAAAPGRAAPVVAVGGRDAANSQQETTAQEVPIA